MPTAITATVGAADANSFITEAEADTYLGDRLNAGAWNDLGAGVDTRLQALIEATRELNRLPWAGTRVDSTQALSWPRDWVVNPDLPWAIEEAADIYYYLTTEIPQRVKDAQAELTLEFLRAGTTDIAVGDADQNVRRKKTDVLETEYWSRGQQTSGIALYPRVVDLIWDLLDPVVIGGTALIRG